MLNFLIWNVVLWWCNGMVKTQHFNFVHYHLRKVLRKKNY